MNIKVYQSLLTDIKVKIRNSQIRATLSVNAEMINLCWGIGRIINDLQNEQGWGAAVTTRLANDIRNELPEIKGFSERNLKFMVQFYKAYNSDDLIGKQPASQLGETSVELSVFGKQPISQIPWGHNILLLQKLKDKNIRLWYAEQTILNGWSRDILALMIKSDLHLRQGESINP